MKTPKTIPPWMQRLALTVAGSALCLGARAQEITLNIAPAVHVSWATATNKAYQVELSTNVPDNWVAVGDWIEGTGGGVGVCFDASAAKQFFRVQQMAASSIGWLEGVWRGDTYSASPNSVTFTTQISIANNNRSFGATYSNQLAYCTATLDLLTYSDAQARFHSKIQSGPCADGVIVVTRLNPTNLLYNWYFPEAPTMASSFAVLSKTQ
ncbi:MAG TPA: hypothetical protein VFT34_10290 [Verrucomicrobiae bacterium]|nr:hypothetical protein [Verrucomicrobiae bacterium]